jgi:hypothetical protein
MDAVLRSPDPEYGRNKGGENTSEAGVNLTN